MQNKSAIWVFAVLLTLACVYQLSFNFIVSGVESDAEIFAQKRVDSVVVVDGELSVEEKDALFSEFESKRLLAMNQQEVYPLLGFTYRFCKEQEINLGLDLQGGMNVTLEVSVADILKGLAGSHSRQEEFVATLASARAKQRDSQDDLVTLFGEAFNESFPGAKLWPLFNTLDNKGIFPRDGTNEEILDIIRSEAESSVSRTEQVIRKRIDNLGVVQPKVQRLGSTGRILVELPGVKDKRRVRKLLQGTAKLEFWDVYENYEVINKLSELDKEIKKANDLRKRGGIAVDSTETEAIVSDVDSVLAATPDTAKTESDDLMALLGGDGDSTKTDSAGVEAPQNLTNEERRAENPLLARLQPNLVSDQKTGQYYPAKGAIVGIASIADTSSVSRMMKSKEAQKIFSKRDTKFFWGAKPYDKKGKFYALYAAKIINRDGTPRLDGQAIKDARAQTDAMGNPEISMSMKTDGAKTWKVMTREASADQNNLRSIAVVLDDLVYSAPTVHGEIGGGVSQITGQFSVAEAQDLANVLKAGKLPAPARIIEEAVVGPSLGKEAIEAGLNSFLVALAIILIYMMLYYSGAGGAADVALLANLFFVIGVLASIGATLTLPGIAGIVLTIGMSVDANVLIYERIREELTQGKGLKLAISDGYKNAYSSIIDANITTLLTGIALYIFGSGPIKGFATTLIIGILTSLFCAIFITRLIFEWQLDKNKKISFSTKFSRNAFKNINLSFVKKRKMFYVLSGLIIVLGIGSFATRGFNFGVDFTGGRTYLVRFEKPVNVANIGSILATTFIADGVKQRPEVKTFGNSNQVKITTSFMIDDNGEDAENIVEEKLTQGLNTLGDKFEIMSSQKVGPTIADDIKQSAIWAILFSLVVIFLYILLRFKKWQFGLGALVALIHDVLIVLAIFSLCYGVLPFSLEIDSAFIAAILTVVGYSINDTVVVFDRIREHLGLYKRKELGELVNGALNSTLSRTFNTSLSTFFVLLMIFIFGGEVIRGFVFALMIGVVVGTYSSLCVATPVMVDLIGKKDK